MSKFLLGATWEDAPHLTRQSKDDLWAALPPHMRDSRSKGIPTLGAGAIFPIPESAIVVNDFEIPKHWPRGYGMDCGGGAKPTAAAWFAVDRDSQIAYLYSVYKRAAAEPSINAAAIRARGDWIRGVADASGLLLQEHDVEQLVNIYRRLGLDINLPDKAFEAGILDVWEALSTGKLKVFATCQDWLAEFRLYRRDGRGRVVKSNDHLMDATRYFIRSGRARMRTKPVTTTTHETMLVNEGMQVGLDWMT